MADQPRLLPICLRFLARSDRQKAGGGFLAVALQRFPLVLAIAKRCESLPTFLAARPEAQPDYPESAD